MSMTLDGFIKSAFPIDGRLNQLTCGHPFLNGCNISRSSPDQGAAPHSRTEQAAHQGPLASPPSSVIEKRAFGDRLKAHLAPRLGQFYAEFEQRIDASGAFGGSGSLSFDNIARFSAVAYEVAYFADARDDIEVFRARGMAAFAAMVEPTAADDPGHRCVQCVSRDVSARIRSLSATILENAPQYYRPLLARLISRAIADVGQAKKEAARAALVPAADAGRSEQPASREALLQGDVGAGASEGRRQVAAADADGKPLFQRLFGCFFSGQE